MKADRLNSGNTILAPFCDVFSKAINLHKFRHAILSHSTEMCLGNQRIGPIVTQNLFVVVNRFWNVLGPETLFIASNTELKYKSKLRCISNGFPENLKIGGNHCPLVAESIEASFTCLFCSESVYIGFGYTLWKSAKAFETFDGLKKSYSTLCTFEMYLCVIL